MARHTRSAGAYAKKFSGKYEHRTLGGGWDTICRRKPRKPLRRRSSMSLLLK